MEPNEACHINGIDLVRDFGIAKILEPKKIDSSVDFERHNEYETYLKSSLILTPIPDWRSRTA
jgi:hypothetical protein